MADRLFVGVLGHRKSGKSYTWNALFGNTVRTGEKSRLLELRPGEWVEVFLISGSNEERKQYAGDVLENQTARIILCSIQYVGRASDTIEYVLGERFSTFIQWISPGYHDVGSYPDYLGLTNRLLYSGATVQVRSGKDEGNDRVRVLAEHIYGWAAFRGLIISR